MKARDALQIIVEQFVPGEGKKTYRDPDQALDFIKHTASKALTVESEWDELTDWMDAQGAALEVKPTPGEHRASVLNRLIRHLRDQVIIAHGRAEANLRETNGVILRNQVLINERDEANRVCEVHVQERAAAARELYDAREYARLAHRRHLDAMNWRSSREWAVEAALTEFDRMSWWRRVWIVAAGHRFYKTYRDAVAKVPGFVGKDDR